MGEMHGMGLMALVGLGLVAAIALVLIGAVVAIFRPLRTDPSILVRSGAVDRLKLSQTTDNLASFSSRAQPIPFSAYVVIPDISGYTKYLTPSCFHAGHAQFVVGELLEAILGSAGPKLIPAKLEGDAVLFYAPAGSGAGAPPATGQEIADAIDAMLAAFYRRRKKLMVTNACQCVCCRHIGDLDLKVVVDYGEISPIEVYGSWDISGLVVIRAHRLLKNAVPLERYILVSETAVDHVIFPGRGAPRMHAESYDDIGELVSRVYGLSDSEIDPAVDPTAAAGARIGDLAHKIGANLSLGLRRN